VIVTVELVFLAWLRYKFFRTSFLRSFVSVTVGGQSSSVWAQLWE